MEERGDITSYLVQKKKTRARGDEKGTPYGPAAMEERGDITSYLVQKKTHEYCVYQR